MRIGLSWYHGYGASLSPPIFKDSNYCYLVFYYNTYNYRNNGRATLSVFIEELNGNNLTELWSISETERYWKKKVITLPRTSYNYAIVFFGQFKNGGAAFVDDMEFIRCGSSCKLSLRGRSSSEVFL